MFLPVNKKEMLERGINQPDFVYVCGDAYVDHPSFGHAIISRILEAHGFSVVMMPQPDISNPDWMKEYGKPRLAFLVSAGNIDSMVNHYYVSKKRRQKDYYTPGGVMGKRPDHATITYSKAIKKAYPEVPVIIGGVEASLRRLCHYDYISDALMKSILLDSFADLILYGMGERNTIEVAEALDSGLNISDIIYVRGTVWKTKDESLLPTDAIYLPTYNELKKDKLAYAKSFNIQYENTDPYISKPLIERYDKTFVVQNIPSLPLTRELMDWTYGLDYERTYHPMYEKYGGVPAIIEVENSITVNRGCFGSCSFCAITSHQGRIIQSRSKESVVEEAIKITKGPNFKGYINDVGGPTANFYKPSCKKQLEHGTCPHKHCLHPDKCKNLEINHDDYLDLLRTLRINIQLLV